MIKRVKRIAAASLLFSVFWLTGCASILNDPHFKDATTYPNRVDIADKELQLRLSFLARNMMESDDRQELLAEITETSVYKGWSSAHTSIATQMATDIAVGQAASTTGNMVGNSIYAASLIWGEINDGSMEEVGQAFLPEEMYGVKLDTPEKAQNALAIFTKKQVQSIAKDIGWEYKCIHGCESWNQIFTLSRNGKPLDPGFIYQPEMVVIKSIITLPVAVEPSDPVSAMAGFPVKWKTPQGHTYLVGFYSEPYFNEKGDINLFQSEGDGHFYPGVKRKVVKTRLGRELLRKFHSTKYTIYGNQDIHPKQFYFEGKAYSFIRNSDSRMVDLTLDEKVLLN